ncbi:uncharacterized protein A4U43_C06F8790 [Asparagus officinalis]|uniref:pyruvate kinase n=1 Tax=Asparagus officinalis TaxID=4686 RepID=A0A5P1EKH5_ASPOF|nr:plastidial pyruvate kinase 4, chloroplastic-like [Asparagus officinalis]ONK66495.1 uncharacterized protein A4U43_C06F8790 [Asparagus officinalis]
MKMASISLHLVVNKAFTPNHGNHTCNLQDLRSKSEHQLSSFLHGHFSSSLNLGYHPLQLQLRSKKSLHNYLKLFAKLQENDDPKSNDWKPCKETLHAATHEFESNPSSQKSSSSPSTLNSQLDEDSKCQSIAKEDLCQYPFDYELYLDKLKAVLLHVLAAGQWNAPRLKMCDRKYLVSSTNLIHYLALRSLDVQQLTDGLSSIGLMNLDGVNSHVLASINSCISLLVKQAPKYCSAELNVLDASFGVTCEENQKVMETGLMRKRASMHATELLGTVCNKKEVHIMVTVGKEAIAKQQLLPDLLKAGADIIRINSAHDDSSVWSEIIRQAKHSSQMLEKPCRILMDLAGPKLRTGFLNKGPSVMKISPKKDVSGNVIVPAQVWLSYSGCDPPSHISPEAVLYVESERFLHKLEVGSIIRFVDARGKNRSLKVCKKHSVFAGYGYTVEVSRTAYIASGTRLRIERKKGKDSVGRIVNVPSTEQFIRLRVGDLLTIYRDSCSSISNIGSSSSLALKITCDSGRLFDSVKPGEPIAFDDGKIWGVIRGVNSSEIVVSITHARPNGSKLGSGKSINIPESSMQFEGLTSKDLQDLEFVASNADMVGISFIRNTSDIDIVMQELARKKLHNLGVVLKIETRDAFEKLPLLLLQAMQFPNPLGVMIARGDLAVDLWRWECKDG